KLLGIQLHFRAMPDPWAVKLVLIQTASCTA
ncbi:hypothetical protein PSYPI_41074, partial [Pseudomonas syringae pv. pisi str. 1704B]